MRAATRRRGELLLLLRGLRGGWGGLRQAGGLGGRAGVGGAGFLLAAPAMLKMCRAREMMKLSAARAASAPSSPARQRPLKGEPVPVDSYMMPARGPEGAGERQHKSKAPPEASI